jgi:hypothetical protein
MRVHTSYGSGWEKNKNKKTTAIGARVCITLLYRLRVPQFAFVYLSSCGLDLYVNTCSIIMELSYTYILLQSVTWNIITYTCVYVNRVAVVSLIITTLWSRKEKKAAAEHYRTYLV